MVGTAQLLTAVLLASCSWGSAQAHVSGMTHIVVPCYNEETRLPIQKFLQYTSDEVGHHIAPVTCELRCAATLTDSRFGRSRVSV